MGENGKGVNVQRIVLGASIGLVYGCALRFGYRLFPSSSVFKLVTVGFILFTPLAMGFITIFVIERHRPQPVWTWFLLPWVPVLAGEAAAAAFLWEGLICIAIFTPIALMASTV